MVIKNRCIKNTHQGMEYEIKSGLLLYTQNKMLPTVQSVPQKMSVPNYSVTILKPKIIQLCKRKNKPVSLFLQEPSRVLHNRDKKEKKIHQVTYKPKLQKQQSTIRDRPKPLKTSISDTLKKFYKSQKLIQRKKGPHLPFPNTVNSLKTDCLPREKITNYNKKSSISTLKLKLNSAMQQKPEVHNQLDPKLHSASKQIVLYENKNTLHSINMFPPTKCATFQKKQQKNTDYINIITTNFDHIQNKNLTKTTKQTALKTRPIIGKNSSTIPVDQLVICNLIESKLHVNNSTKKKNDEKEDKAHFNYSEHMMKITNYENKTLEMCHHKICNLTSNIDGGGIKKSMSAIQYKRPVQCMLDIRSNISDPYIVQNKYDNQKNRSRFKMQYSLEDTDCTPMSKKDTHITSKYKTKDTKYRESGHDCKIKYSWQVIGTSCQTSNMLLYNFLEENNNQIYNYANKRSIYKCNVKYSWQIIGTGTQVALQSNDNTDYWKGIVFKSNIHQDNKVINSGKRKEIDNDIRLHKVHQCEKELPVLNNQYTQTLVTKEIQSYFTDCKVKYSWQNLVWQHL